MGTGWLRGPLKVLVAITCYLALLGTTYQTSYSSSGFLVFGLGSVLLLDRYLFRLLRWSGRRRWTGELWTRIGYVLLGAAGYYLTRHGVITLSETVFLGIALSLAAFLFECATALVGRLLGRIRGRVPPPRRSWAQALALQVLFFGGVVFTIPLLSLHLPRTVPRRTPSALGLAYEEVRFTTADGLELGGWLICHPQARGSVIFCHGHGCNRGHVVGYLGPLRALGVNVLAFDFRGHGDSPGHTETFGHREVQDVIAAHAYVRRRFPGQPVFIVGVSYGAAVALQALPDLPGVRGVWAESCFSRLRPVVENELAWLPAPLRGPLVSVYSTLAWLDCGFWGTDINPINCLRNVSVPICFCHGREDRLVPFTQAQALYQAYAGPKWSYWVEGANHYNIRQRARVAYARCLRAFFEQALAEVGEGRGPATSLD